jgi:hypothetical protein
VAGRKSVDEKLDELEATAASADRAVAAAAVHAALGDRSYRVVAAAARLAAGALMYEHVARLEAAFRGLVDNPVKRDPGCFAKKAIVRALVELDCADVEFLLEAMRYTQHEPVWGGTADTAIDVRASAAMGLVASGYPRALIELAALLADPEPQARVGAARAIACGNPKEAELLLRAKALFGDADPVVTAECLAGLLTAEPDETPAFVARFLDDADETICELAALALGESRVPAALGYLQAAWDGVLPSAAFRRALIRAAAMHRSDDAFAWLLTLLADADARMAEHIVEVLAIYRHNESLAERVRDVLARRGEPALVEEFAAVWKR